jgi:lipoprotein NlpD
MAGRTNRIGFLAICLALAMTLAACSSKPTTKAPVEDRTPTATQPAAPDAKLPPGAENAGKPGYYTVKRGDTVMRIGLETGQAWRDIVRWNNLENPNLIEVGQVLRVIPPAPAAVASAPGTGAVTRPVASSTVTPASAPPPAGQAAGPAGAASAAAPATAAASASAASVSGDEETAFIWPGTGAVIAGFDEAKNKGLDLAGKAGDPVMAAADGRVVYAGAGLRGYGNLIILKHNNTYLTAYAHNQTLLVKEDQTVRKGQKIAEMGNSDADRVKLHFEIRRQGKPVDPAKYLPPR